MPPAQMPLDAAPATLRIRRIRQTPERPDGQPSSGQLLAESESKQSGFPVRLSHASPTYTPVTPLRQEKVFLVTQLEGRRRFAQDDAPVAGRDGVKSPKVMKALRRAIEASGLSIRQAGDRVGDRANLQKRLRGDVAVTAAYAARFEKALELEPGSIENLVRDEALREREAKVQARIREGQMELRTLRESRRKLS